MMSCIDRARELVKRICKAIVYELLKVAIDELIKLLLDFKDNMFEAVLPIR